MVKAAPIFMGLIGLAMIAAIGLLIVYDVGDLGKVLAGVLGAALKDVISYYKSPSE